MIIYCFSTWGADKSKNKLFDIERIEVEEKPKSYVSGRHRINKCEIGVLSTHGGNRMYCLTDDPKPYINAMVNRKRIKMEYAEKSLIVAKSELSEWEKLQCRG